MSGPFHKCGAHPQPRAIFHLSRAPPIPPRSEPFVKLNTHLGGLPAFDGNAVELLPDYLANLECIAQEIDRAQRFVHIEYFTLSRDEDTESVFAAMERAHRRGVNVLVPLDHLGSRKYPN